MPYPELEEHIGLPPQFEDAAPETEPPASMGRAQPFTPVVTGSALVGLLYAVSHWAPPILKATGRQRRSGLLGWLIWTVEQVARYITPGVNFVEHTLSKGLTHNAAAPATMLNQAAWRWRQLWVTLAHFAADTAVGFERVVHVKTPQAVRRETRPLKRQVRQLRVGEIRLGRELHHFEHYIERLLRQRVLVPLHQLGRIVHRELVPDVRRHGRQLRHQQAELGRHEHELDRLRWVLPFAGAVPLVLYALKRLRLNSLLCRNTRGFNEEVCAMPTGYGRRGGRLLRELIEDLLSFIGIISVVTFAVEVYELLNVKIPLLNEPAMHYIQAGISELSALRPGDYLGPAGVGLDLRADDYLGPA